jgi:pilus assembly protein Flp/PilA
MRGLTTRLRRSERGATSIEYGLICALIVLAMMGALKFLASTTIDMWSDVTEAVTNSG